MNGMSPILLVIALCRKRVIGATQDGRILTIILAPSGKSEIYYPVTARPADRKERALYTGALME